ncbi:MotA/TolQ/ExbB proton channel family protein [Lentibacillus halodurans]|uniref:MotA/TolQ/ExbB proton channel family protein n=1 Tax=Lentibacillus halodurans TaxID=237679 RepID=A0A1I0W5Q3_9BACI|nr:MotA/TolQ/ExbB proton channel family protein [Lentibacillus halodurans]SFA83648.1 MotA/TolQ/ExbB proton channel family protein [Lentibacillus halodurans]
MLQLILELFTSERIAEDILANPITELIFVILFMTFFLTLVIHLSLFTKLNKIRHYLVTTNQMSIEPLNTIKAQYDRSMQEESIKPETFVQEKFSAWRIFNIPVVNLIKMVQMTVSVFILIGVLGTFIGLTVSLGSINTTGGQLVENVTAVLSGIDVAFYTSIAGMGLSLIMTVLIKVFNTEYMLTDIMLKVESHLEGNQQDGISQLIDVSKAINHSIQHLEETNQQSLTEIEHAFSGFQEYTSGLQQSAKDLTAFNDGLSSNLEKFQELFHHMKDVTDGFGESTSRLNNNFDSLFSYFKKMDGKNERMAKAFENTYERIKEVSEAHMDTLNHFEESVGELKSFTSSIMEEQKSIHDKFESITEKSHDLAEKMGAHNQEFKQVFGADLSAKLTGIITNLGELSKDFDKMGDSISQLPEALDVINRTQAEYKYLLSDRFDELKEFNRTFNRHLKAHSYESQAFERKIQEAAQTYEKLGKQNNELIHDINKTISQMNNTFNQRENQVEASVDVLKNTLTNYVNGLEGILGDKLDKVAGNINESVDMMNAGIKEEFQDIKRLSEDIQQSNSRYIQQMLQDLSREIQGFNRQLNRMGEQGRPNEGQAGTR